MKKFLLVLLSLLVVMSCELGTNTKNGTETPGTENPGTEGNDPSIENPDTEVVVSRGKVLDGSGNVLGYSVFSDITSIHLLTPKGYMLKVNWVGEIESVNIYYTEVDGNGVAFNDELGDAPYLKSVFYGNNTYYVFRDIVDGKPVMDDTIKEAKSDFSTYLNKISNDSTPSDELYEIYAFKEIDRAEIDYPENITGALVISFE